MTQHNMPNNVTLTHSPNIVCFFMIHFPLPLYHHTTMDHGGDHGQYMEYVEM